MDTVKLMDGTEVDSSSEEWRHECEARAIAALPTTAQRREWLEAIQLRRGLATANKLRETLIKLWNAK